MANNRLWLVHRPTGEAICLGKRMGWGWYSHDELSAEINAFFDRCIEKLESAEQDDFVLALEDASGAPNCIDDWTYDDHKPRPTPRLTADEHYRRAVASMFEDRR